MEIRAASFTDEAGQLWRVMRALEKQRYGTARAYLPTQEGTSAYNQEVISGQPNAEYHLMVFRDNNNKVVLAARVALETSTLEENSQGTFSSLGQLGQSQEAFNKLLETFLRTVGGNAYNEFFETFSYKQSATSPEPSPA